MISADYAQELHNLGLEKPRGFDSWSTTQRRGFLEKQKMLKKRRALMASAITQQAVREKYLGGTITFKPPVGTSTFRIRGVYGPAAGLALSRVATLRMDSDSTGTTISSVGDDYHTRWGPRRFLHEVFNAAAQVGGRCDIYLTHSKLSVGIDPQEFEDWLSKVNADPTGVLLGEVTSLLTQER